MTKRVSKPRGNPRYSELTPKIARGAEPVRVVVTPEQADLITEITNLMTRAHGLGMHRTGHALHEAVRTVGYEVADNMTKELRGIRSSIEQASRG